MAGLAYSQAVAPTAVEHCALGNFTGSSSGTDLVLSRGTVVEVYSLWETPAAGTTTGTPAGPSAGRAASLDGIAAAQLRLRASSELNGRVLSMCTVPAANAQHRDRVVLAFADAKLSIVEFDVWSESLHTVAVHSFESLATETGCIETDVPPLARVHADGSCAALLAYGVHLVVLPLRVAATPAPSVLAPAAVASLVAKGSGPPVGGDGPTAGLPLAPTPLLAAVPPPADASAAPLQLGSLGAPATTAARPPTGRAEAAPVDGASCARLDLLSHGLRHVRDIAFLHGYAEPALAVLCEPSQTWSGRLAWSSHTCLVSAWQLSTCRHAAAPLWEVRDLPHDTASLLPLPSPTGGVLALSSHVLLWLSPSVRFGLALCRDASCPCVPKLAAVPASVRITLAGATATILSSEPPLRVALSLANGDLYLARLRADGRGVTGADLSRIVPTVPASCLVAFGEGGRYLFLGSAVADSLLLQLHDPQAPRRARVGGCERDQPGTAAAAALRGLFDSSAALPPAARAKRPRALAPSRTDSPPPAKRAKAGEEEDAHAIDLSAGATADDVAAAGGGEAAAAGDEDGMGEAGADEAPSAEPVAEAAVPLEMPLELPLPLPLEGAALEEADLLAQDARALARAAEEETVETWLYAPVGADAGTPPTRAPQKRGGRRVQAVLRDSLVSTAPITDVAVLPPSGRTASTAGADGGGGATADGGAGPDGLQLLLCGGRGRSGSLSRVGGGVRLASVASFEVPPCDAIFTLETRDGAPQASEGAAAAGAADADDTPHHSLLLMSTPSGSRVLSTGDELSEITTRTELYVDGPTLLLAPLRAATRAAQVYAGGVRLLRGEKRLAECGVRDGRCIARASAADDFVLCLLDDGSPWLLRLGADGASLEDVPHPPSLAPLLATPLLSATLYADAAGLFATASPPTPGAEAGPLSDPLSPPGGALTPRCPPSSDRLLSLSVAAAPSADAVRTQMEDAILYAPTRRGDDLPNRRAGGAAHIAAAGVASGVAGVASGVESGSAAQGGAASGGAASGVLCVALDASGRFSLWELPEWRLVFSSAHALVQGAALVVDESAGHDDGATGPYDEDEAGSAAAAATMAAAAAASMVEVRLLRMRDDSHAPLLALIMAPHRLLLYRPFVPAALPDEVAPVGGGGCRVRFKRVPHRVTLRSLQSAADDEWVDEGGADTLSVQLASRPSQLVSLDQFDGVGAPLDGSVLLLGEVPVVLCMLRDTIWAHELKIPQSGASGGPFAGAVTCAAPLHNVNCSHGVMIMGPSGQMQICTLQPPPTSAQATRYDFDWPLTRVGLRATGHGVCHLPHARAIIVATSTAVLLPDETAPSMIQTLGLGDDEAVAALPGAARFEESYELRLLDDSTWETLDTLPMGAHEWIVCMRHITLQREKTPPPPPAASAQHQYRHMPPPPPPVRTPLVAVGTGHVLGEDKSCTGRVLLVDVTDEPEASADGDAEGTAETEGATKEGGGGDTKGLDDAAAESDRTILRRRRLRLLVDHEERAPVLSIAQLQGLLIGGVGSRLVTWVFRDDGLVALGFYIAGFGVSALSTLSNYVLAGDLHQGVQLLSWKPERQSLTLVSRHIQSRSAYCCDFMLHEGALHLVLAEEGPTLRTLNYSRQAEESRRGTLLLPRAALHLGASLTRLQRVAMPNAAASVAGVAPLMARGSAASAASGGAPAAAARRHALVWTATDGSIGFVTPLEESAVRRLSFLATKMVVGLPHIAGLNPRAFRARGTGAATARELKNMVDGPLVARFQQLGEAEQQRLALQIGSTPRKVLAAIAKLASAAPR